MRSPSHSSKRDTWNASTPREEGKSGQSQSPPAYGVTLADSGPQSIRASRDFPNQQKSPGFRESKDKSFHPDSQYQLRPADDAYEQQADRLAEKIMTQQPVEEPVKKLNPPSTTPNRKQEGEGVKTEVGQEIKAARGKGSPLPEVIRRPAEKALGKDLSRVRLHTGARAERINQSINAEAAAVNQDIFATRRAADVHSPQSRAILLHETVHTLQQNGGDGTHSDKGSIQPFSIRNAFKRFINFFRRSQAPPAPVLNLQHEGLNGGIQMVPFQGPAAGLQPALANQGFPQNSGIYGAAPPLAGHQPPIYENVRVHPQGHLASRVDSNYDVIPIPPQPRPTHAYGQAPSPYEALAGGGNYQRRLRGL